MSILTSRELEFLASLNTRWRRLYGNELVRLLKEDDSPVPISLLRQRAAEELTAFTSGRNS
jgi:hypothetical protein